MSPEQASAAVNGLARFMFDRQAATYDADPEEANLAWLDPNVQSFWVDEATAVILWLAQT